MLLAKHNYKHPNGQGPKNVINYLDQLRERDKIEKFTYRDIYADYKELLQENMSLQKQLQ